MSFQSGWAFFLLIPLFLLAAYWFWRRSSRTPSLQFSQVFVVKKISSGWRAKFWWLAEGLKYLSLVFVIIALARPQTSDTQTKRNVEGIDIMIALDISDSMLIEDMKPNNRLEAAKDTIKNFIKGRSSDRIGMVIFAGESFTLVPLTLDYDLVLSRLEDVTTAQQAHIKDGTAIGVAMANAAGKLKDSVAKTRVIVFMTDGENNSGLIDPETGLSIAKGYGIKVYSIGMGSSGPTKIPIYQKDMFGNKVKTYQPFESTVNDDLLGRMASETGGKYYRASKEDSLGPIFKDIDKLERTKIDVNKYTRYTELYQKYLWMAFWTYLLSLILSATVLRRAV
jgi:Ca-activated chloride channel family protein